MKKKLFNGEFNKELLIKCVVALLFPALLCIVYCAVRGIGISELFLPASYNNDCVFYYKQIEGILKGGIPVGYFGFDESRAAVGGLAAWSHLIYFPWIVWGRIFGWNFASVLVCNVVLFGIALAVFTLLTKPGTVNYIISLLALALFPSLPIHLLNALPEAVVASVFIVFLGLSIKICEYSIGKNDGNKQNKKYLTAYIVAAFVFGAFLTIIRPYMIVFLAVPIYVLIKAYGKKMIAVSALILFAVIVAYVLITKFFTADYFSPLFDTGIVKLLLKGKIGEAFWTTVSVLKTMTAGIAGFIGSAFKFGSTAGTQYVMAIIGLIVSGVLVFDKESKERKPVYLVYFIALILLLGAIVLFLQKSNEGARHLWIFAIAGCLILPETVKVNIPVYALKGVSIVLLIIFIARGSLVPTDYDIPVGTPELRSNIEEWKEAFKALEVDKKATDGFENTVAWVFVDYDNGDMIVTEYAPLYVLPAGMGISCCYPDHILADIDSVKCRYIYTDAKGEVAKLCEEKNMNIVAKVGDTVIYERVHE